jgi:ferredoxin
MTHTITAICLRDTACVDVCPVECIIPGKPESEWPWLYIDPDTCIDCGACVPECPYEAIFPEDEVPTAYTMKAGQYLAGDVGGHNVKVENAKAPGAGFVIDLTPATELNKKFFTEGPGYSAKG